MTKDLINKALTFFGMGRPERVKETCTVAAEIVQVRDTMVVCDVIFHLWPDEPVKRCEFLRSEVRIDMYGQSSALVEIPKTYLPIFLLWDFVLPEARLLRLRQRVTEWNAPYLKAVPAKVPERSGLFGSDIGKARPGEARHGGA